MEQGQQSFDSQTESTAAKAVGALQEQASELGRQAKRASSELLETRVDKVFGFLDDIEGAVRAAARELQSEQHPRLAQYVNRAADEVASARSRFGGTDLNEMISSAEHLARTRPVVVLGMAFAAGFAFVRMLKSSTPHLVEGRRGFEDDDYGYESDFGASSRASRGYGSESYGGGRQSGGRSSGQTSGSQSYAQSRSGTSAAGQSYGSGPRSGMSGGSESRSGTPYSGQSGSGRSFGSDQQGGTSRTGREQQRNEPQRKDDPVEGRDDE